MRRRGSGYARDFCYARLGPSVYVMRALFATPNYLCYPTLIVPSSADSRLDFPGIAHTAKADVVAAGTHLAFVAGADGISRAVLVRA